MASASEITTYDIVPAADNAAVEHVYNHLRNFWFKRHNLPISEDEKEVLIQQYQQTYYLPVRAPLTAMLREFCENHGEDEEISFIEVGGANGTTLHYLKSFMNLGQIRYLGVEPFSLFREDFVQNFPDQQIIDGDAEKFSDMDLESMIETPVSAVLCFLILCMTPPRVASAFLIKAAQVTDDIIIHDYVINFDGAMPDTHQWLFKYDEDFGQIYFIHQFGKYFDDIGFEAVKRVPAPLADGKIGWEVFHFRRRK